MSILKHLNWKWLTTVPYALGDRYYTQDLVRDFRFLQDMVGTLAYDTFGQTIPRKVSGGVVTKGAGDTLNITLGRGWVAHSVEIPDTFASIPPSKMSADITGVPVAWGAQTNLALPLATLNGVAVNYVKVRYLESDGNTRDRAKTTGTYSYESVPSYQFVVDTVAPTIYDLVLTTFTGTAGGSFTIADPTITYPYWETLSALPIGSSIDYSGVSIPYGWLKEDGASLLRASYPTLFSALTEVKGTCTIAIGAAAFVTISNHGLITGDCVSFTTTGSLPTGLSPDRNYYAIYFNTSNFTLANTYADAKANISITTSGTQSGTHTLTWNPWGIADATHFYLPDTQGLSTEGSGQLTTNGAAWGGANYTGRLGQYKQDRIQGFKVNTINNSATGGGINTYSVYQNHSFDTNANVIYGLSSLPVDGGYGTPRYGLTTYGPRVGKYKIIKVI